jgi:hypothetical protein
LARRMPPWGAIKGFGQFRNDQSLTPEQIELITKWVDGGIRRGNNPRLLPKEPVFEASAEPPVPKNAFRVQGSFTLPHDIVLEGSYRNACSQRSRRGSSPYLRRGVLNRWSGSTSTTRSTRINFCSGNRCDCQPGRKSKACLPIH